LAQNVFFYHAILLSWISTDYIGKCNTSFTTIAKYQASSHYPTTASIIFLTFFIAELFLTFLARNVNSGPSNKELFFLAL
jgi:hypothetical protein